MTEDKRKATKRRRRKTRVNALNQMESDWVNNEEKFETIFSKLGRLSDIVAHGATALDGKHRSKPELMGAFARGETEPANEDMRRYLDHGEGFWKDYLREVSK